MHLDVLLVVTCVVTFVFTLVTMVDRFLPPLLGLNGLCVNAEEPYVGVDDDLPPLRVLPHLMSVLGPDRLQNLRALVTLVLASMQSFVLLEPLLARKLLATVRAGELLPMNSLHVLLHVPGEVSSVVTLCALGSRGI